VRSRTCRRIDRGNLIHTCLRFILCLNPLFKWSLFLYIYEQVWYFWTRWCDICEHQRHLWAGMASVIGGGVTFVNKSGIYEQVGGDICEQEWHSWTEWGDICEREWHSWS